MQTDKKRQIDDFISFAVVATVMVDLFPYSKEYLTECYFNCLDEIPVYLKNRKQKRSEKERFTKDIKLFESKNTSFVKVLDEMTGVYADKKDKLIDDIYQVLDQYKNG